MIDLEPRHRAALVSTLAALALFAVLLTASSGTALATNNSTSGADYYNKSVSNVSFQYWFDKGDNATLTTIGDMAARFVPAVIGTGSQDSSGTGFEGYLLTGLVFAGGSLVALLGTGVGPVGGVVIGLVMTYGMIGIGLAPAWLQPLVLFGIGIGAAIAALRITRA